MQLLIAGLEDSKLQWLKEFAAANGHTLSVVTDEKEAVIVLNDKFNDPTAFNQFISTSGGGKYLLPTNIETDVIQKIITTLSSSNKPTAMMPPALIERYRQSIYEKIILFDLLSKNQKDLKAFKDEVHKIAGSAGTFGFPEMTTLSRKTENILSAIINGKEEKSAEELKKIMDDYQYSLKLAFQNILHN